MTYDLQRSFQNLARYNETANEALYATVSALTDRARKKDAGSWFGSIHAILNHLIICDINWLRRFRALSPGSMVLADPCLDPPGLSWNHDLHDDFENLRRDRSRVDGRIRGWFAEYPASGYGETFSYEDSVGTLRHATAGRAFEFLFLHQTHHRGQVSQILDRMGLSNSFADNAVYIEGNGD